MSQQTRQQILASQEAGPSKTHNDGASMSATLLAPLNELQALAHILFLSLSPPQSKPPPPPPISAFLECDKALASAMNLAHTHQIKQRRIDALEAEILDLEAQWREICTELAAGKVELEELIEEGNERIKAIEEAKKGFVIYSSN
jgi:mediator of RNA polymerase II transcription subunit 4